MTRRSKRSIERALDELGDERSVSAGPSVDEEYPDDVAAFIKQVTRGLFRICHRNADEIVNASDPAATERFLELVRERHEIEEDRDDEVRRTLTDLVAGHNHWDPIDGFSTAPMGVAATTDLETPDGETLTDLVRADRGDEASRLLVGTTYEAFADRGGRRVEVPA